MIRRPYVVIALAAALCVPTAALASSPRSTPDSASVNCGGSGVDSLYCIPQQSVFAFTHVGKGARCSIQVSFTVEPTIKGLSGHANVELSGTGAKHNVKRVVKPLVVGGGYSLQFKKLSSGDYKLSGWYEGDGTRLASAHKSKRFTLHCG
jgi:hypothetical protein